MRFRKRRTALDPPPDVREHTSNLFGSRQHRSAFAPASVPARRRGPSAPSRSERAGSPAGRTARRSRWRCRAHRRLLLVRARGRMVNKPARAWPSSELVASASSSTVYSAVSLTIASRRSRRQPVRPSPSHRQVEGRAWTRLACSRSVSMRDPWASVQRRLVALAWGAASGRELGAHATSTSLPRCLLEPPAMPHAMEPSAHGEPRSPP